MSEIASRAALARRLIKRPRLTRLLDETKARTLMLVAPAGYGKTTLAREWLEQGGRRTVWYRGGPAAADVAGLAAGLARVAEPVVPTARRRIEERLRASSEPEAEAELLAEMLAEDLAGWPDDAWLCFDDYQFAMDSAASERFFDVVRTQAHFPLILTSRERPAWASARQILYGEILELGRNALAFTLEEASELLADTPRSGAPGLIQLADGWPAVLGLAALSEESDLPDEEFPGALYGYFAEELYQKVEGPMRDALWQLSLVPSITVTEAFDLVGPDAVDLLQIGAKVGFLGVDQDGAWSMHPLLRGFLREKLRAEPRQNVEALAGAVGAFLITTARWDEAFVIAEGLESTNLLSDLVRSGLRPLLRQGRGPTIARWLSWGRSRQVDVPHLDLAEAELALRSGDHRRAESLAVRAAQRLKHLNEEAAWAWLVAGRAAHLGGRDSIALDYVRNASDFANDDAALADALWLELQAYTEIDPAKVAVPLERLRALDRDDAGYRVRLSAAEAWLASQEGRLRDAIDSLLPRYYLLPRVDDPMIRSSFLFRSGYYLMLGGRYEEALRILSQALAEANDYRLAFALPHILTNLAAAHQGLRNFAQAHTLLDRVVTQADRRDDLYLRLNERSVRCRVLLSERRLDEAVSATQWTPFRSAEQSIEAEYLATRALALACSGSIGEATAARAEALSSGRTDVEVRSLIACTDLLLPSSANRETPAGEQLELFRSIQRSGCVDAFVCSYRARPELLEAAARLPEFRSELRSILEAARDSALGREAGLDIAAPPRGSDLLTPREREVHALLAEGLSNRQIARQLYISEATVKVHVRHILEKVGARTRTEAAVRLKLDEELVEALRRQPHEPPEESPPIPK